MQQNNDMLTWLNSSSLGGINQTYIEQLYEEYLKAPQSIDASWREIFDSWPKPEIEEQAHSSIQSYFRQLAKEHPSHHTTTVIDPNASQRLVRALQWINAFRYRGHLRADLDPLKMWQRQSAPNLDYQYYGLTDDEADENFNIGKYVFDREYMTLRELEQHFAIPTVQLSGWNLCISIILICVVGYSKKWNICLTNRSFLVMNNYVS